MVATEPIPQSPDNEFLQNAPHSSPHYEDATPSPGISDQAISEPPAGTENAVNTSIYPPIPAYSPTWSNNEVNEATAPPPPEFPSQGADADVVQYNMSHGVGIVNRLPEAFPEYQQSLRSSVGPPESLPPYGANNPPRYTRFATTQSQEPQLMAKLFFKFGFFFPAFWVFGALMLITPLRTPSPLNSYSVWPPNTEFSRWCSEHLETEEDRAEYMKQFQAAEMEWARRCLLATFLLVCFSIAVGATIFGVLKSTSKPAT